MIKKLIPIFFLLLNLVFFLSVFAQKAPLKWGKVSKEETNWTPQWNDKNYEAFVLFDYGVVNFSGRDDVTLTRHKRIMCLNKPEGGSIEILIPFDKADQEEITRLKAQVLRYEGPEKYEAIELEKNDMLVEDTEGAINEIKLRFNNLQAGSVVEYQYSINSRNPRKIIKWEFQSELPTMHSEVRVSISDLVKVDIFYRGSILSNKYRNQATNQWVLTNTKEIADEPLSPFPGDYIEQISFQIAGFYEKSSTYGLDRQMDFTVNNTTWGILAVEILKSPEYTAYLEKKINLPDVALNMLKPDMSDREKIQELYSYTIDHLAWNKNYSVYPDPSQLLQNRSANGSAINLFFIALLKEAGFDASPVLLSTRDHGTIQTSSPDLSQFNHLIASVKLYGKDLLMDASDRFTPYDLLPVNDLNGKGYLLGLSESRWVDIAILKTRTSFINTRLNYDEGGMGSLIIKAQYNNYAAAEMRRNIAGTVDTIEFSARYLLSENTGYDLDSLSFQETDELSRPLKVSAAYQSAFPDSSILSIRPFIQHAINPQLFIPDDRTLPMDFVMPFEDNNSVTLSLPNGYQIDKAPGPYELSLPGNKGVFSYQVTVSSDKVKVKTSLKFIEHFFQTNEYPELKEFFEKYVNKISEKIVFSKTE